MREGQSGPCNDHIVGMEQAGANLRAALSQALAESAVAAVDAEAACAGMAALDGRGPATGLADRFRAMTGRSPQEWIGWLADLDTSISHAHFQLRSFAPFVAQAAAAGDTAALSILNAAGAALADTAAAVLANSAHLRQALRAALTAQRPGCRTVPARAGPAYGASLLARNPALMPQDVLQTRGQPACS